MVDILQQQILPVEHLMHGSRAGGFTFARQLGTNGKIPPSFPLPILFRHANLQIASRRFRICHEILIALSLQVLRSY